MSLGCRKLIFLLLVCVLIAGCGQSSEPDSSQASNETDTVSTTTSKPAPPPKVIRESPYIRPSQDQKMWAMALGALLTQHNGGRHDILGGHERTPEEIQAWRASLAAWWDIETRADLITSLNWIERGFVKCCGSAKHS